VLGLQRGHLDTCSVGRRDAVRGRTPPNDEWIRSSSAGAAATHPESAVGFEHRGRLPGAASSSGAASNSADPSGFGGFRAASGVVGASDSPSDAEAG